MEKNRKLECLWDYQHFERNEMLEKRIMETKHRYAVSLSEDELGLVNAAGPVPGTERAAFEKNEKEKT